jgi:hypothetical protein
LVVYYQPAFEHYSNSIFSPIRPNPIKRLFEYDYDYQLDPIRFKQSCPINGLVDEYYGGESDAYKDRYIPYLLNYKFYELNRDY